MVIDSSFEKWSGVRKKLLQRKRNKEVSKEKKGRKS